MTFNNFEEVFAVTETTQRFVTGILLLVTNILSKIQNY